MPSVNLGARGLPLLLRLPGTGGRRSGTEAEEEEDMARLFCLSPGKNNSLGSARVATVEGVEKVQRTKNECRGWGKLERATKKKKKKYRDGRE